MIIYIKMDLALNNRQMLICHKTQQPNKPNKPTGVVVPAWVSSIDQIEIFNLQYLERSNCVQTNN